MKINDAVEATLNELTKATEKFAGFKSLHEGYAVMLEEFDELWADIKRAGPHGVEDSRVKKEAIQVAAMSLRFLTDCVE